jgi:hypothetical protein
MTLSQTAGSACACAGGGPRTLVPPAWAPRLCPAAGVRDTLKMHPNERTAQCHTNLSAT